MNGNGRREVNSSGKISHKLQMKTGQASQQFLHDVFSNHYGKSAARDKMEQS